VTHHIQEVLHGPYNALPRIDRPLPPTPHSHHTSVSGNSDLVGATSQIYLPEVIYLGVTAPTRNRTELHIFKQHCLFLLQNRTEKHICHPLTELQTITPHIGAFNKFFWKYRTSITINGILEDYRGITHHSDTRTPCLVKNLLKKNRRISQSTPLTPSPQIIKRLGVSLPVFLYQEFGVKE